MQDNSWDTALCGRAVVPIAPGVTTLQWNGRFARIPLARLAYPRASHSTRSNGIPSNSISND